MLRLYSDDWISRYLLRTTNPNPHIFSIDLGLYFIYPHNLLQLQNSTEFLTFMVFCNIGSPGSKRNISSVSFLFKYFLHKVTHFHSCRRLTQLVKRFGLVRRVSCVLPLMLEYNLHLDSVFVTLVTSTSCSWKKDKHDVISSRDRSMFLFACIYCDFSYSYCIASRMFQLCDVKSLWILWKEL